MLKFCPNCGEGLEKVVNYCPNCGYKVKGNQENSGTSVKNSSGGKAIICDVCGEENSPEDAVCNSCGARLANTVSGYKRTVLKSEKRSERKNIKPGKQIHQSIPDKIPSKLENSKIITIIGSSVAVVFVVLLLTGVFDTKPKLDNESQGGEIQAPQVNLQSIQKINALEERLKGDPKNAGLLLELAHLRNDSGFNEKAIENYMEYLEIQPDNADARVDMGVCYYKLSRFDEARAAMEKALEYQPKHQIAHLNLGIVNLAAGNLEKSREWLRKAIKINPNSDYAKEAQRLLESHTQ
jgi:Tfp pilus assembly protein PilF